MAARVLEYDPMNDVLFKFIFGSDERKHITISFLNAVLEREGKNSIREIEFHNVELVPQREDEKLSRIDIFAVLDDNERVDIEVQCVNHQNMAKSSLFYWAQMFLHSQSLQSSQNYRILKPAIAVNVLNFNFLPFEEFHSIYGACNLRHNHILTDAMELHFLEVPKLIKRPAKEMPLIEKWLGFCSPKFSVQEKGEIAMTEPVIQDAMEAAERFMGDENFYRQYLARQSAIWDYNSDMLAYKAEGHEEGLEQGEDKLSKLFLALSSAGRQDDFAKACSDKTVREKLYNEFNIV